MDFRKKINFFSQFGKTGSLLPCIGDDTVFDYIMLSLINLCLKKTLGGDSIIFCSRINLLFFVCVVTKGEFWLKYLVCLWDIGGTQPYLLFYRNASTEVTRILPRSYCQDHVRASVEDIITQIKSFYNDRTRLDRSHTQRSPLISVGNSCLSSIILAVMEYCKNLYAWSGFQDLSLNKSSFFDSFFLLLENVLQEKMQ